MQGREAREVGREARSYRTASHRVIDRDNGDGSVRCRRNSGREREGSCRAAEQQKDQIHPRWVRLHHDTG